MMMETPMFASRLGLTDHDVSLPDELRIYHVTLASAQTTNGRTSMDNELMNIDELLVFASTCCGAKF